LPHHHSKSATRAKLPE